MARRRLTPAQPGYTAGPIPAPASSAAGGALGTAGTRIAPIAQVSGQSAEAAALREMAQGLQAARDEGRMIVDVPLSDVSPGFLLRDRIAQDREELDALKGSIRQHGQRVPAEITPLSSSEALDRFAQNTDGGTPAHRFGLISGWRRLTALNELHSETGEARFSTLRALIRPVEETADSYVAMIEENEIRVGLSYFERARVVAELTRRDVFPDQTTALRTLFGNASRAKRSKIGSFVELVDGLGDVLRFPVEIPERLGLALVARLRLGGSVARADIIRTLQTVAPDTAAAELALLEKLARPVQSGPVSRAKQESERLAPGLTLSAQQKKDRLTLTFSGTAADGTLLEDIKAFLKTRG